MGTKDPINVGDWVWSYSSGIWQVYRVIHYKTRDALTLGETDETMIFSKKFLSESMKPSFREECCAPAHIEHLSDEAMRKTEAFILNNPDAIKRFEGYQPKDIDMVYNSRIALPDGTSVEDVEKLIPKDQMFSVFEIEQLLSRLGLLNDPCYDTAQFVSPNFTCRDGYLVHSLKRVLQHNADGLGLTTSHVTTGKLLNRGSTN
jgi:hypothetical protein